MIFVFIEPSYEVCKIAAVNTINCAVRCTLSATGNALDKALWLPHTLCLLWSALPVHLHNQHKWIV